MNSYQSINTNKYTLQYYNSETVRELYTNIIHFIPIYSVDSSLARAENSLKSLKVAEHGMWETAYRN